MPELTDEDRRVLTFVASWYRTERGALPASRVAEATGLPWEEVLASAGVLAAAGRVRTYRRVHRGGAQEVHFVGLVDSRPRVVDLRASASWRLARG